jgi:hypothetical protein
MMDDMTNKNLSTADLARTGERDIDANPGARSLPQQSPSAQPQKRAPTSPLSKETEDTESMAAGNRPDGSTPLFAGEEASHLRSQWENLQVRFVDEPRRSVEGADQLVAETIKRLAEGFADERQKLEQQWDRGVDVSTEDLRQSLRRYRSFFERLLAA